MKMRYFIIGLIAVVVLGFFYLWGTYNRVLTQNEAVENQWAQVEAQYQRRFDLIPNLVESVKGVLTQEQEVFGQIAEARTRYSGAGSVEERVAAVNQLESALGRLLVIVENYPQLRSSETVRDLMVQLEGTENRISVERVRFNDVVREYNVIVKRIPTRWVASMYGYEPRAYFESVEGSDVAPPVDLQIE